MSSGRKHEGPRDAHDGSPPARPRPEGPSRSPAATLALLAESDRAPGAVVSLRQEPLPKAPPEPGPLAGLPFAVKDNIAVRGFPLTCGAPLLRHHRPVYDATAVARLEDAGAVVVAKTNLDAFGMGTTGRASCFEATANPLDRQRIAGGSSAGSAAVVAAGLVPFALGSDTGGSVRIPAAFCGVIGFKPSWGRVSRSGLVAHASSLDVIGWLTRSAPLAAAVARVTFGSDPRDASSRDAPFREPPEPTALRIGALDPKAFGVRVEKAVLAAFGETLTLLESTGARLVEVPLHHAAAGLPCYGVIAAVEAASNLARFDGVRFGEGARDAADPIAATRGRCLGEEVVARLVLGARGHDPLSPDDPFALASGLRRVITDELEASLADVDVLISPVAPSFAPRIDALRVDVERSLDAFTVGPSLAGLPALSLPVLRVTHAGLPFALQLVGKRDEDERLLALSERLLPVLGGEPS